MKYVIFDFNGTILDDTDAGMKAENHCIEHFGLNRGPMTKDEYLHVFTFPVKNYYEKIGFDWSIHSFEEVGAYWFKWYCALKDEYKVHEGVIDLLISNRDKGIKNVILSASSLVEMKKQLVDLGILEYFDDVLGIDNIYGGSKLDIALKWIEDKNPEDCIMLGDTLHDLEVARAMNVECILIANGHQAKDILVAEYDRVLDDIRQVKI